MTMRRCWPRKRLFQTSSVSSGQSLKGRLISFRRHYVAKQNLLKTSTANLLSYLSLKKAWYVKYSWGRRIVGRLRIWSTNRRVILLRSTGCILQLVLIESSYCKSSLMLISIVNVCLFILRALPQMPQLSLGFYRFSTEVKTLVKRHRKDIRTTVKIDLESMEAFLWSVDGKFKRPALLSSYLLLISFIDFITSPNVYGHLPHF